METNTHYDAIIIGGGPAGLTAGIYLSRARVKTLILNEGTIGGQMVLTHEIANYPGVESISGYQLSNVMKKQAKTFGCDIKSNITIQSMDLGNDIKTVVLEDGQQFSANAVILSPGGRSRTLGIKGEAAFKGKGISYCATCDGDFFTDKEIVVVGGGNSALEEAVSLTKYASKVTIVHQFDHFQAFEHAIDEAKNHPKINFKMESTLTAFYGNDKIESVDIKNIRTGQSENFKTDGVFIFIGYIPNTEFLKDKLELNTYGEIVVKPDMSTNITGVYAAGDSIAKRYRQVTTAVGEGTIAALAASEFLNKNKNNINHELLFQ
ncbi:MAG: thioredoxin-disulfide reductase [Bacteroidetes bacterium HGW-Bacteroidetes-21]|jgi:thioredoxin reductase (NADPH)|nr:MAG: thioredoxin-disulfide reductase [Bacteroidetes bacterium HGW-Bacteroidetes-21]